MCIYKDLKEATNAQIGHDVENNDSCLCAFHDFSVTVSAKLFVVFFSCLVKQHNVTNPVMVCLVDHCHGLRSVILIGRHAEEVRICLI